MRLAKETLNPDESVGDIQNVDIEALVDGSEEDKTFAAMGVAKTIETVRLPLFHPLPDINPEPYRLSPLWTRPQRSSLRFRRSLFP